MNFLKQILRPLNLRSLIAAVLLSAVAFPVLAGNVLGTAEEDFFRDWEMVSNEIVYREIAQSSEPGGKDVWGLDGRQQQLGLQGHLFSGIHQLFPETGSTKFLHGLSAGLTSISLALIVVTLYRMRERSVAVLIFAVALLSPWFVSAARNLYWIPWATLIPLGLALLIAQARTRRQAVVIHILLFLTLVFRFGAGYEFVSSVMILIALAPFLANFSRIVQLPFKTVIRRLYKKVAELSVNLIGAFISTLVFHAYFRGEGSIRNGVLDIYRADVLRRTFGDPADFPEAYRVSLESSVLDSLEQYFFRWRTNVLSIQVGPDSALALGPEAFWLLVSLLISGISLLYITSFRVSGGLLLGVATAVLPPLSWFVLAKGHSIIHPSINFLLWYPVSIALLLWLIWFVFRTLFLGRRQRRPSGTTHAGI